MKATSYREYIDSQLSASSKSEGSSSSSNHDNQLSASSKSERSSSSSIQVINDYVEAGALNYLSTKLETYPSIRKLIISFNLDNFRFLRAENIFSKEFYYELYLLLKKNKNICSLQLCLKGFEKNSLNMNFFRVLLLNTNSLIQLEFMYIPPIQSFQLNNDIDGEDSSLSNANDPFYIGITECKSLLFFSIEINKYFTTDVRTKISLHFFEKRGVLQDIVDKLDSIENGLLPSYSLSKILLFQFQLSVLIDQKKLLFLEHDILTYAHTLSKLMIIHSNNFLELHCICGGTKINVLQNSWLLNLPGEIKEMIFKYILPGDIKHNYLNYRDKPEALTQQEFNELSINSILGKEYDKLNEINNHQYNFQQPLNIHQPINRMFCRTLIFTGFGAGVLAGTALFIIYPQIKKNNILNIISEYFLSLKTIISQSGVAFANNQEL